MRLMNENQVIELMKSLPDNYYTQALADMAGPFGNPQPEGWKLPFCGVTYFFLGEDPQGVKYLEDMPCILIHSDADPMKTILGARSQRVGYYWILEGFAITAIAAPQHLQEGFFRGPQDAQEVEQLVAVKWLAEHPKETASPATPSTFKPVLKAFEISPVQNVGSAVNLNDVQGADEHSSDF